jgi:N-acetylmuramoyl-L-alanine amidase
MKVANNLLVSENGEKVRIDLTSFVGGIINPTFVIIHYTATANASSPINFFKNAHDNPQKVAAHIVLDKDGAITQMVPFNKKCSHAGLSNWDVVEGMNSHSIGIEIVNLGPAPAANAAIPGVIKKGHKNNPPGAGTNQYWYAYPQVQLTALYKLCKVILAAYPDIKLILGHDDVSPYRKQDPGPAFSWNDFRMAVYGATNDIGKIFTVNTADSKFRSVPSTLNNTPIKALPIGYQVGLIATSGDWCRVYLNNSKSDVMGKDGDLTKCYKTIGWIHKTLLNLKPGQ